MGAVLIASESRDLTEQLFLERISRAERRVATQRQYVCRLEAGGLDVGRPLSLLWLMEAITEQLRTARRLYRASRALAPDNGAWVPSAIARQARRSPVRSPAESSVAPAANAATFACSHCGLLLTVRREDGCTLIYDMDLWHQRCCHPALQTPVLCQLLPSPADAVH